MLLPLVHPFVPVLGALEAEEEPACQEDSRDGRKPRVIGDGAVGKDDPFVLLESKVEESLSGLLGLLFELDEGLGSRAEEYLSSPMLLGRIIKLAAAVLAKPFWS